MQISVVRPVARSLRSDARSAKLSCTAVQVGNTHLDERPFVLMRFLRVSAARLASAQGHLSFSEGRNMAQPPLRAAPSTRGGTVSVPFQQSFGPLRGKFPRLRSRRQHPSAECPRLTAFPRQVPIRRRPACWREVLPDLRSPEEHLRAHLREVLP